MVLGLLERLARGEGRIGTNLRHRAENKNIRGQRYETASKLTKGDWQARLEEAHRQGAKERATSTKYTPAQIDALILLEDVLDASDPLKMVAMRLKHEREQAEATMKDPAPEEEKAA